MNNPDLNRARRTNQAYEMHYGPEVKLNAPIIRDMAADKVIERRSWFPAVETAAWFESPTYMTRHDNMKQTAGLDLRNRNETRAMLKPGQTYERVDMGPTSMELDVTGGSTTSQRLLYLFGIIIVIGFIVWLF